jgi:hypothetical protein
MFSYKWTKSLECLKIKKFKPANKVNIINKNVSIRVSIFIFELNYNVYIRKRKGEMNMENTMKMYITADEVAELLGVSRGYAYKVIRGLNDELKAKGFRVISGKVPRKYFQEKFYGMVV